MEGYILKKGGGLMKSYQRRYFELKGTTAYYYKDQYKKEEAGTMDMAGVKVVPVKEGKFGFNLEGGSLKKKYELRAETDEMLQKWIQAFNRAIEEAAPAEDVEDDAAEPPPAAGGEEPKKEPAAAAPAAAAAAPAAAAGSAPSASGDGASRGTPGVKKGTPVAEDQVRKSERKEVKANAKVYVTKSQLKDGGIDYFVENESPDGVTMRINLSATKGMNPTCHEDTTIESECACAYLDPEETVRMLTLYKDPNAEAHSARVGYQFTKDDPSERFLDRQRLLANENIEKHIEKIKSLCTPEELQDLESVVSVCKKNGIKFVDIEMPPASFGIPQFIWQRPCEFLPPEVGEPVLFDDCIEPNDIFQGSLGDCWYMCALATMAEFPDVVRKCLPERPDDDPTGSHRMRICKDGWWKVVIIDDFLPCNFGRGPAYAKNKGEEMWSAIMEKAYAKVHGSFAAMCTGLTGQALAELTGFPYKKFSIRTKGFDTEKLWEDMSNWDGSDFMMSAGTPGDGAQDFDDAEDGSPLMTEEEYTLAGFITAHSYSVIDCKETHGYRLLKIRNPWGGLEWNGDWSDDSPLWTEDIRNELAFEAADDGLFWMSYEDFLRYFVNVTVCYNHIHEEWRDIRAQAYFDQTKPEWHMQVTMLESAKCFISISQKDKRSKAKDDPEYEYYEVGFMVLRPEGEAGYAVHEWTGYLRSRDVWVETYLEASDRPYIIIPWTCFEGRRLFNMSFLSQAKDFGFVTFHEHSQELIQSACMAGTYANGKEKVWSEENGCSIFSFPAGRFLGVLAVNRSDSLTWNFKMNNGKCKNYKVAPPGEHTETIEMSVPCGSMRYVGTFLNVSGVYQFEYGLRQDFTPGDGEGNEGFEVGWNFGDIPKVKAQIQENADKKDVTDILTMDTIDCTE